MLATFMRSSRRVVLLGLLPLALLVSWPVMVPAQVSNAVVTGIVTDAQGGILPGVTITLMNTESGVVRTILTGENGRYSLGGIPPGRYSLKAELPGFATQEVKDITLTIGLEYPKDFIMGIQGLQETITITGDSPVVETTKTEVAGVVTQQQIETLPFQDRGTIALTLLLPGTGTDTTRAKRSAVNVGAGISTSSTSYLVDGLSNATAISGEQRHDIPQAAIREFAVHTTQVPAQFGQRAGGVVSIATKSGTNDVHGEAFEFFRNKSLNTLDKFQELQHATKPDYKRHEFGAALGGPILKNRLHYFGTFERTREHSFFTVNTGRPDLYKALEGTFEGGYYTNIEFVRADYQINNKQNLFYRYINQHTDFYCSGCGANSMAAFSNNDDLIPRDMHAIGHTWAISNRVLNEFYFMQGAASDRGFLNKDYAPKQYQQVMTIPASMGGGTIVGSPVYQFPSLTWGTYQCLPPCVSNAGTRTRFTEAQEALSISAGKHSWKFGGSIQLFPTHEWAPGNIFGTWTFSQDQYFNPSDPNFSFANLKGATRFQASFPNLQREMRNHNYAVYVMDEWKPSRGLTLNLGLRYDLQTGIWDEWVKQSDYPRPLPYTNFGSRGDKNNFGPRLGLAWNIANNGKSTVRMGYGVVYTSVTNIVPRTEVSSLKQATINLTGNVPYPDPYQGRDPATFVSTAPPNINIIADNLVNAPVHTSSIGFSQQLTSEMAVHVDGVYQKAVDYPTQVQVNTRNPVTLARPLPEWGQVIQYQPIGKYSYKGLLFRLEKRLSHNYQYQVAYTLAKQDSNFGSPDLVGVGIGGVITDNSNPGLDVGPSNADRRHELVFSGGGQLPAHILVGAIWNLRTSYPFSAKAGIDLNGDGALTDYVPGTTKNMGNRNTAAMLAAVNAYRATLGLTPFSSSQIDSSLFSRLDLRISKAFALGESRKVELIGQIFNVLGRDNLGGPSTFYQTNVRSDAFGKIQAALPRQQGELAIRFVF
jgi:hypothetical protein